MSAEPLFRKILSQNEICILATASKGGKTEAATIEYASDGRFNVYFETFAYYRKYKNIKENPCGSIVLNDLPHTIQMDGKITELSVKEAEKAKQLLAKKYGKERSVKNHQSIDGCMMIYCNL